MLTPLLAKCRALWPDAELAMTCPPPFVGLYATAALRRARAALRSGRRRVAGRPAPRTPRSTWRSSPATTACSGSRVRSARAGSSPSPATPRAGRTGPSTSCAPYPDVPMAWGDLCAHLVDGPAPAPFATGDWPQPPVASFRRPRRPYVVLHVGASSPLKQWPVARWRVLGQRLADARLRGRALGRPRRGRAARPHRPFGPVAALRRHAVARRTVAPPRRCRAAGEPGHRHRPSRAHRRRAGGRAVRTRVGAGLRRRRLLAQEPVHGADRSPIFPAATSG